MITTATTTNPISVKPKNKNNKKKDYKTTEEIIAAGAWQNKSKAY